MRRLLGLLLVAAATTVSAQNVQNVAKGFSVDKSYQMNSVDQISTFNGNLSVALPIGPRFTVSSTLSYQFYLTYNGNVWDFETTEALIPVNPPGNQDEIFVEYGTIEPRSNNAGVGWSVSLGHITEGAYYSADGAEHRFYTSLHGESPSGGASYTRDGSYLRQTADVDGLSRIEFPDGTYHLFLPDGRLASMHDRFGNSVTIDYVLGTDSEEDWQVYDGSRSHKVDLKSMAANAQDSYGYDVVDSITFDSTLPPLQAPRILFNYAQVDGAESLVGISRQVAIRQDCRKSAVALVPVLESVTLVDGSKYEMTTDRGGTTEQPDGSWTGSFSSASGTGASPNCVGNNMSLSVNPTPSFSGHLLQLKHPTGARTVWTLQTYKFPPRVDNPECTDITHCNFNATSQSAIGVKERFDYDRTSSTTPQTMRTYEQAPGAALNTTATTTLKTFAREPVTGTWTPVSQSLHYYTTPWQSFDDKTLYGLPFTRDVTLAPPGETNPSGGRWLSSKLLDGAGNLLRYNYVSYESDAPNVSWENSLNRRMKSERVVQLSGGSIVNDVLTTSNDFDGVGHYRTTTTTTGTAPAGQEDILPVTSLTATTLYNAVDSQVGATTLHNTGTYPFSFAMWPTGVDWVLNTYGSQTTQETVNGTIRKAKVLFQFDPYTGFLLRRRVLKNIATDVSEPALHSNDLLSVFDSDGGNVGLESHYGGDGQSINDQQQLALMPLPASPVVELTHTYEYGALKTSQYTGIPFLSADRSIDRASGLPVVTTDPAGVQAWLEYDTSGRLKWSLPVFDDDPNAIVYGPVTEYAFTAPSSAVHASVTIRQRDGSKTATPLTTATVDYDDFGRVWIEKRTMPDGTTSTRETLYDERGQVRSVSEWGDLAKVTSYTYDSLGRVLTATAPDQSVTEFTYVGGRTTTRKSRVATTTANDPGTLESTVETTDDLGRLVQVTEPGGTVTKYGYDLGGHLALVKMIDGTVIQERKFTYDGRGLLESEIHPESGTTNYEYDARGHMIERTPAGSSTVTFQYDAAERLYRVSQGTNVLKFFTFDRPNDDLAQDKSMGKMASALRHNYGTPYGDLQVTETFRYKQPGGRLSAKETTLSHTGETFIDSYKYDKLGGITELTYPACAGCNSDEPSAFKVTNTYTRGALTGVTGYTPAGGITYSPNGMVATVRHLNANGTNGPLDTQTYDTATGMARPLAISFTNFCPSGDLTATLTSKTVTAAQSANLTVATTGTVTTYQWFELLSNGSSVVVSGQTGATLGVTMSVTKKFWVRIGNGTCTIDSNVATVTVNSCTPPNATITLDTAMPINRNVTAQAHVPASSDPNATYAWAVSGGTPVGGASTPTFTFKANCGVSVVTLSVTVTASGCQSSGTQNVTLTASPGATLSVAGSSTIPWSSSSNATINVALTGGGNWAGTWSGGGPAWTNNTGSFSRPVTLSGTTTYSTTVSDATACPAATSNSLTITVTPPTPLLTATATSATQVQLTWSLPAGFTADSYDIERRIAGGSFTGAGSTTGATSWSGGATANTAYLYRVRAIKSGTPSAWSNSELATTVIFLDEPVVAYSTTLFAYHIDQLRTAVNAARTLAGLSVVTFTDASVSMLQPKTVHIQELRNALASARSSLGLPAVSFTDPTLVSGGDFKAVYINQLRGGVQ